MSIWNSPFKPFSTHTHTLILTGTYFFLLYVVQHWSKVDFMKQSPWFWIAMWFFINFIFLLYFILLIYIYIFKILFYNIFLKITFHLQILQNIVYMPHGAQYILEPTLHSVVCISQSSAPTWPTPPLVVTGLFTVSAVLLHFCYIH